MKKLSETYKELGIAFSFPIEIKNTNGLYTYYEDSDGYWRKREYDAEGNGTYYEDSEGYKKGTPRSQSCDDKDKERLDWLQSNNLTLHSWEEGDVWGSKGAWTIRAFIDREMEKTETPRSQSFDGKVIEMDGNKYKLTEL